MSTKIGNVTKRRYNQLVREGRQLVEQQSRAQWKLGDAALEIEPIRDRDGEHAIADEELYSVSEALELFAEDIGAAATTIKKYRYTSARWPEDQRRSGVSHTIHQVLGKLDERFEVIDDPPMHERSGERRWTVDAARRVVGWRVRDPESTQEKIDKIHDLAADDAVAGVVATDFLRRPNVASKAMRDATARGRVNWAQVEHSRQAGEIVRQRTPALEQIERSEQFVELVGACSAFVASVGRTLPTLRGHKFSTPERETVHRNVARVRTTADWIETAVDTGEVSLDEGLARLLRGE
ncbi:DUF6192 family protein [Amycolatopsis anabasis]|uniref:DUF6192 family protein n=1 Tax=Amycolatopsis anabasis TaxID=1840409 RepID=UPI001C553648|nr:DUF6192 family protein [Amycolatopsis anabasis]